MTGKLRNFCIAICFLVQFIDLSTSETVDCKYLHGVLPAYLEIKHSIYYCSVKNELNIDTIEKAQIDTAIGIHDIELSNENVTGFYTWMSEVRFFPRNLANVFGNLLWIDIWNGKLAEIHQDDLKQFPKLIFLELHENLIEVIEDGLFDYNPELLHVSFQGNKIFKISPTVFDNLNNLVDLWLDGNSCVNMRTVNDVSVVKEIIQHTKTKCDGSNNGKKEEF